jgi:hypothetical protein
MEKPIEKMTYAEFKVFTDDRACDGRWSLITALACIEMRKRVDAVKVKGLFKRKATEEAQEKEWQKLLSELNT